MPRIAPRTDTDMYKSNIDFPVALSSLNVPTPVPKIRGSWKRSNFRAPEFTSTDAEPLKRFRGSDEDPVLADAYVMDGSQHIRRHRMCNTEEDRPCTAVQSWANRFSSRTGSLFQDLKKGVPSRQKGNEATAGSSPRRRHYSGPATVRPTATSLATTSTSSALPSYIESLPHYAQPVYAQSTFTTTVVGAQNSSNAESAVSPVNTSTLSGSAGLTMNQGDTPAVADPVAQQTNSEVEGPSDANAPPFSTQQFQFFTSDPQTAQTAACLPTHVNSGLIRNPATATAIPQTQTSALTNSMSKTPKEAPPSRQPLQQIILQSEKSGREQSAISNGRESSTLPAMSLQPQAAVELPKTTHFTEEDLYYWVTGWNSQWLDIYGPESKSQLLTSVPPILAQCPFKQLKDVPLYFNSLDDYYRVFVPLLLHEIWAQMQNKSDMSLPSFEAAFVECKCKDQRPTGFLLNCTCRVTITEGANCPINCRDVVKVLPGEDTTTSWCPLLAVVTNVTAVVSQSSGTRIPTNHNVPFSRTNPTEPEEKSLEVSLFVLAKNEEIYRALSSNTGHKVQLKVVHSLVSAVHQFNGLISLPKCRLLASDILRFRRMDVFCPSPEHEISTIKPEKLLNPCQLQAISVASKAVAQPETLPRICLLQGPPGTGKTQTVIGLVKNILESQKENQYHNCLPGQHGATSKPAPILLCAPSHFAVNVLLRRLIGTISTTFLHQTQPSDRGGIKRFHIVRVGRSSLIHESVKRFSLDSQVQAKREKEVGKISLNQDRKTKRQESLTLRLNELGTTSSLHQLSGDKKEEERSRLIKELKMVNAHLEDLRRQRAELDGKPNSHYEHAIISNADIICCTVNGSGSELLQGTCGRDGKQRKMKFSCVIVDEANQCTELDSIIPLQNSSMKVVMIGDPQQLPAAVVSKEAEQHGLHQSLFERLCRWFQAAQIKPSPIHLLQKQHRMHTEIAAFPSKHFYNSNLQSDKTMAKRKAFFLHPYLLFNVVQSKEIRISSSAFTNGAEASMVMELYIRICNEKKRNEIMVSEPLNIGIIVSYKEHASDLLLHLKKADKELMVSSPKEFKLPLVDVSTMDRFQGREKDVVIASCVRAQEPSDNLGLSSSLSPSFIGDRKRMNFILTRARYSLFIVAHLSTLQKNRDWGALVADAGNRKLIVQVQGTEYAKAAKRCSKYANLPPNKVSISSGETRPKTQSQNNQQAIEGAIEVCRGSGSGETASIRRRVDDIPSTSTAMQVSYNHPRVQHGNVHGQHKTFSARNTNPQAPTSSSTTSGPTKSPPGFHPLKRRLLQGQLPDQTGSPNKQNGAKKLPKKPSAASPNTKSTMKSPKKRVHFKKFSPNKTVERSLIPKPMQTNAGVHMNGKPNPYRMAFKSPERKKMLKRSPKLPQLRQALKKSLLFAPGSPQKCRKNSPAKNINLPQNRPASISKGHRVSVEMNRSCREETISVAEDARTQPGQSKFPERPRLLDRQSNIPFTTGRPVNSSGLTQDKSPAQRLQVHPSSKPSGLRSHEQLRKTVDNLKQRLGKEKRTLPLPGLQPDPKLARRRSRSGSGPTTPETEVGNSNERGSPRRIQYFPDSDSISD